MCISVEVDHRVIELYACTWRYLLISPFVIDQKLAPTFGVLREMRIEFIDIFVDGMRLRSIALVSANMPATFRAVNL